MKTEQNDREIYSMKTQPNEYDDFMIGHIMYVLVRSVVLVLYAIHCDRAFIWIDWSIVWY